MTNSITVHVFLVVQIFNSEEYMLYGAYTDPELAQAKIDSMKLKGVEREDFEIRRYTLNTDLEI